MKRTLFSAALLFIGFGLGTAYQSKQKPASPETFCITYKPTNTDFTLSGETAYKITNAKSGMLGLLTTGDVEELRNNPDVEFKACAK